MANVRGAEEIRCRQAYRVAGTRRARGLGMSGVLGAARNSANGHEALIISAH